MIILEHGVEGIQLNELFKFIVLGCGHKSAEVRNETILIIKEMYK